MSDNEQKSASAADGSATASAAAGPDRVQEQATLNEAKGRAERPAAKDDFFDAPEFDGAIAGKNHKTLAKQKLAIMCGAAVFLGAGLWYIAGDSLHGDGTLGSDKKVAITMTDAVDPANAQKEWMARTEVDQQQLNGRLNALTQQEQELKALKEQLSKSQNDKSSMESDGKQVFNAYEQENQRLRAALEAAKAGPGTPSLPSFAPGNPIYKPAAGASGPAAGPQAVAAMAAVRSNEIKMISFMDGKSVPNATPVEPGKTVYSDSANYLPPNSFATARVIVGVDAAAGVKSQTDPLPVVLRVTGPARSVYAEGKLLKTNIQGCLVNGAAQGDLSSEKVYVKLQRMTCPQPGGRYAVSEVKGFISFGGKTGVRGRVVSREGSLATQAFLAGMVGGFGRGFSANSNSVLTGANVSVNGQRQKLSAGEIVEGGLGEGVAKSGDMVSNYLIERAEQYQPVIEMPTGIDVEVVFLDGVFIRN
jgi:conjugal transfer pilus assembly protein TraB